MDARIAVTPPYRLDLTVRVLRRLPTNIVDILTPDGQYIRALDQGVVRVAQTRPDMLDVTLTGDGAALQTVRRMLGVDQDIARFNRAAARIPWLAPLARRVRGVRPPRYPSLWEACINAVAFQQLSLLAASAIVRRLIIALGTPVERDGVQLYAFPSVDTFRQADDVLLRQTGLSAQKLATLRRVSDALASGALDEDALERQTSVEAAATFRAVKGIGPWTTAVILLRGLGRLDVFPMKDSGVARNLALLAKRAPRDIEAVLKALSPQQGMLYYCLLLARLEAQSSGAPTA